MEIRVRVTVNRRVSLCSSIEFLNLTPTKKAEADKMAAEHKAEADKVRIKIRIRIRMPSMSLSNTRGLGLWFEG